MKYKISAILFAIILIFLTANFEQVLACSCARADICPSYNFADYVFVGTVIEDKDGIYIFQVKEGFVGTKKDEELKMLFGVGGSCASTFKKNHTYLIFGYKNSEKMREHPFWTNSFWTTVCMRNSEITEKPSEDLEYLRNLPTENVGGKLFGKVYTTRWNKERELEEIPFANIPISIKETENNLFEKILETDENGQYDLSVPLGLYEVKIELPKGFKLYNDSQKPFRIRNAGCANKSFILKEIDK